MPDFTTTEILAGLAGSIGGVGGLVAAFNAITTRLDARKTRIAAQKAIDISNAVEFKRLEIEAGDKDKQTLLANLWKIIEGKEKENAELEAELKECEQKARLDRPVVNKVYSNLRAMRKEIEHMNLMILNEEETNVFMRRFATVKTLLDETENILP